MLGEVGKGLVFLGLVLLVLGLVLTLMPGVRIGRLPGDIVVRRESFSLYLPITTSILLSLVLSLLFWVLSSLRR